MVIWKSLYIGSFSTKLPFYHSKFTLLLIVMFLYLAYNATFVDVKMAPLVISQNRWPFPTRAPPEQPCTCGTATLEDWNFLWKITLLNSLEGLRYTRGCIEVEIESLHIFFVMTQKQKLYYIVHLYWENFHPLYWVDIFLSTFGTDPSFSRHFWGSQ